MDILDRRSQEDNDDPLNDLVEKVLSEGLAPSLLEDAASPWPVLHRDEFAEPSEDDEEDFLPENPFDDLWGHSSAECLWPIGTGCPSCGGGQQR